MNIEKDKDITAYTTFGVPVKTKYFAEYASERELLKLSRSEEYLSSEVLHIGGGSNLLFLHDFDGMILHSAVKGIKEYRKDDDTVYVIAGAGEKWIDFVDWCVDHNIAGVENLAGIPGEVGASAIQNVGAYGVEACDVIFAVECFDSQTRQVVRFSNEECRFGYRDSIFKNELRNRYYVLRVSFRLRPSDVAENLRYAGLKDLGERLGHAPTIREVADEVVRLRDSKLPDPRELGSGGSFFKNPVVPERMCMALRRDFDPEMPAWPVAGGGMKLSAAWLIDKAGMKGVRQGGAQVYERQPLVLVNRDNATGEDVRRLADRVIRAVRTKFYVSLKPEVNFIDTSMTVTILGSGTSKGVPEVGCGCRVCSSTDPRDRRLRASALIETAGMRILVDPSPDFREQALREAIDDIDAVLITHSHYDHVGGIDDLRPFCSGGDLPMYVREDVDGDLRRRLDYCFYDKPYPGVPTFKMNVIGNEPFSINGLTVLPIEVLHGSKPIYGFRIGDFAYVTDAKTIAPEEMEKLEGLDTLVLNALRDKPHFAHLTIAEAVQIVEELQPRRVYLTHMNHEVGLHDEFASRLPEPIKPAYDGLKIRIN